MKKTKSIAAIFIVLTLILGCLIFHAHAIVSEKISYELIEKMNNSSEEDRIEVYVTLRYQFGDFQTAYEETDLETGIDRYGFQSVEQVREYYRVWRRNLNSIKKNAALELMAKMGVSFADVSEEQEWNEDNISKLGVPNRYRLCKSQINKLSDIEEVISIDLYKEQDQRETDETSVPIDNTSELPMDKLDKKLTEALNIIDDDDLIDVWVSVTLKLTEKYELEQQAYYESGLTPGEINTLDEVNLYLETYRNLVVKDRTKAILNLLELTGIDESQIAREEWSISKGWPFHFVLTKDQINNMIMTDEIDSVELYQKQDSSDVEIPTDPPEETIYMKGDADGDGSITILDATTIQRRLASIPVPFPEITDTYGDITGDGLDIVDATCIQRYLAGLSYSRS